MNLSKANPYAVAAIAIAAALIGTVVCALSVAAAVVPQEDPRADPAVGIAPVADRDVYRNGRFPEARAFSGPARPAVLQSGAAGEAVWRGASAASARASEPSTASTVSSSGSASPFGRPGP